MAELKREFYETLKTWRCFCALACKLVVDSWQLVVKLTLIYIPARSAGGGLAYKLKG